MFLTINITPPGGATLVPNAVLVPRRHVTQTAPELIEFEPDYALFTAIDPGGPTGGLTYNPRLHDLIYIWDYGDPGAASTVPVNVLASWKDLNVGYGSKGVHCYEAAGTYTARVDVYGFSGGNLLHNYSTVDVTIDSLADTFPTTNTLFVSPTSSFANKPTGALEYTSLDAAFTALKALNQQTTPKCIMLNRGESYTLSNQVIGETTAQLFPSTYVVAGGDAGAAPEVTTTGVAFYLKDVQAVSTNQKDFVFSGINFTGPYNSVTGAGDTSSTFIHNTGGKAPRVVLMHDMIIDGYGLGVNGGDINGSNMTLAFVNTIVRNWHGYGIFWSDAAGDGFGSFVTLGASFYMSAESRNDTNSGGSGSAMRVQSRRWISDGSEFYAKLFGGTTIPRSVIRPNPEAYDGYETCLHRSSFEGGNNLSLGSGGTVGNALGRYNFLMDGCVYVADFGSDIGARWIGTGYSIRNCIFINPNHSSRLFNITEWFQQPIDPAGDAGSASESINIEFNTIINLHASSAPTLFAGFINSYAGRRSNNLVYEVGASTADAPIDLSTALWTPRNNGRWLLAGSLETAYATPAGSVTTGRVQTGSSAINDASANAPIAFDFGKNARKTALADTTSRGAWETVGTAAFVGFGAVSTTGGSTVVTVTNTNDSGAGSLRDALSVSGRRVEFSVSGTITIQSEIEVPANTTIAGETSPTGITITAGTTGNCRLQVVGSNVIITHLRIRQTATYASTDCLSVGNSVNGTPISNVIVDHCSFSGATDECIAVWGPVTDVTVSNCIIAEANDNGESSTYGGLVGSADTAAGRNDTLNNISYINNLFYDNLDRNPFVRHVSNFELINNYISDFGTSGSRIDNLTTMNALGNVWRRGPQSTATRPHLYLDAGIYAARYYLNDNIGIEEDGTPEYSGSGIAHDTVGSGASLALIEGSAIFTSTVTPMASSAVESYVKANAGARVGGSLDATDAAFVAAS